MSFKTSLTVRVWDTFSKGTLLDVLEGEFEELRFSTRFNGGFKAATIVIRADLSRVWQYAAAENLNRGRMFAHVEIEEADLTAWEGRVMGIEFDPSGRSNKLTIEALGYWSACRDQWYDDEDAGNTDWAAAGASQFDDVVKEMLTNACPDISTDQSKIGAPGVNINGTEAFHVRRFVQDHIVDSGYLTDGDGDQWYFWIYEDRIAYMAQRDISTVHWVVNRFGLGQSSIRQDATWWRNNVMPIVGTTEGTASAGTKPSGVPQRDLTVELPTATPSGPDTDERDRVLTERNQVQQSQRFVIEGDVARAVGAMATVPKWRVRAGDVLRIRDLVPPRVSTIVLDNLRTFFIIETEYDARRDRLTVTPDRARASISSMLVKQVALESA